MVSVIVLARSSHSRYAGAHTYLRGRSLRCARAHVHVQPHFRLRRHAYPPPQYSMLLSNNSWVNRSGHSRRSKWHAAVTAMFSSPQRAAAECNTPVTVPTSCRPVTMPPGGWLCCSWLSRRRHRILRCGSLFDCRLDGRGRTCCRRKNRRRTGTDEVTAWPRRQKDVECTLAKLKAASSCHHASVAK